MLNFRSWGIEDKEKALSYFCDKIIPDSNDYFFRGITINAEAKIIFRWLSQMKVAPYSYDLIDNLGRRSPRKLTPGLECLEKGQTFMFIFPLEHFIKNKELTIKTKKSILTKIFGSCAITYKIIENDVDKNCRLLVKFSLRYPNTIIGWFTKKILPALDLIMAKKQLRTFKELAEKTKIEE